MKIFSVRSQIRDVAARWRDQYCTTVGRKRRWYNSYAADAELIYDQLNALDTKSVTPDDVAAIIGNECWILNPVVCFECGQPAPALIQFTVDTGDDDVNIRLCAGCLRRAADMLDTGDTQHIAHQDRVMLTPKDREILATHSITLPYHTTMRVLDINPVEHPCHCEKLRRLVEEHEDGRTTFRDEELAAYRHLIADWDAGMHIYPPTPAPNVRGPFIRPRPEEESAREF